jgi:hypothetical protein
MIITKLKGGLGNQMFQYATGFAVANKNQTIQKIDVSGYDDVRVANSETPRKFGLSIFKITSPIALSDEIAKAKYPFNILSKAWRFFKQRILKQNYTDYDPKLFKKISKEIEKYRHTKKYPGFYLDGFFQSEKNFTEFAPQIRQEFTFKKEFFDEKVKQLAEVMQKENSVSVHIRHGDYLHDKKTHKYHGVLSVEYYQDAIELITEKIKEQKNPAKTTPPVFYIFTDDEKWADENFPTFTNISKNHLKDHEEMYLMSQCKHHIIANSSFSWWGAWLNKNSDKIVITPEKWTSTKSNPHPNIIPETWIKI